MPLETEQKNNITVKYLAYGIEAANRDIIDHGKRRRSSVSFLSPFLRFVCLERPNKKCKVEKRVTAIYYRILIAKIYDWIQHPIR